MAADTPGLYLDKLVNLLTGTRALGPAARMREGKDPYSVELDFRLTEPTDVQRIIAWALDQAPYAHRRGKRPRAQSPTCYAVR